MMTIPVGKMPCTLTVHTPLRHALADHGLGRRDKAIELLHKVTASDPNHMAAGLVLDWIEKESRLAAIVPEARPAS